MRIGAQLHREAAFSPFPETVLGWVSSEPFRVSEKGDKAAACAEAPGTLP